MTDTPNRPIDVERRIAAAQAARVATDNQGRPLARPTKYTYDDRGLLIEAAPPQDDA